MTWILTVSFCLNWILYVCVESDDNNPTIRQYRSLAVTPSLGSRPSSTTKNATKNVDSFCHEIQQKIPTIRATSSRDQIQDAPQRRALTSSWVSNLCANSDNRPRNMKNTRARTSYQLPTYSYDTASSPVTRSTSSASFRDVHAERSQNKENGFARKIVQQSGDAKQKKRAFAQQFEVFRQTFCSQALDSDTSSRCHQSPKTRKPRISNNMSERSKSLNEEIDDIVVKFGRKPQLCGHSSDQSKPKKNCRNPADNNRSHNFVYSSSSFANGSDETPHTFATGSCGHHEFRAESPRTKRSHSSPQKHLSSHSINPHKQYRNTKNSSPTCRSPCHTTSSIPAISPATIRQTELALKAELREAHHRILSLQAEMRTTRDNTTLELRQRDLHINNKCEEISQLQRYMGQTTEELRAKSNQIQSLIEQQNFLVAQRDHRPPQGHPHIQYFDNGQVMEQVGIPSFSSLPLRSRTFVIIRNNLGRVAHWYGISFAGWLLLLNAFVYFEISFFKGGKWSLAQLIR